MSDTRVQVGQAPTRCPFCKGEVGKGDELVACASCTARHHAGCHRDHGRCAACGATDVLVSPVRKARRELPPAGSKIRVERGERSTRMSWSSAHPQDRLLLLLFVILIVTIPLTAWLWWLRRKHPEGWLELGEDELTFLTGGARPQVRAVKRSEMGAVRVQPMGQGHAPQAYVLTVDVGIDRLPLWTSPTTPNLGGPELEWIAEQLEAWRDS